jgi:7,8-dihydropterin-6-yl-methyl-4-(beta-D-ribofuranosyl)aminobenzene 5'-phosphate synthase
MGESEVEITLLVDNQPGPGLMAEHGLSVLIRTGGRSILLDTGKGDALPRNAERLGVDLGQIDTVVLSHGHYDHTGGLPAVIGKRAGMIVHFHPKIFRPRYTADQSGTRSIGIPATAVHALEDLPGRCLKPTTGTVRLTDTVGISTQIKRDTDYEDTGGAFFLDAKATSPDLIEDDLVVWVTTDSGVVVVVGCCHAGIINTLSQVRRVTGETRIRAVIGGLHLLHADYRRLDPTMAALQTISPETVVPCHCTGERATAALRSTFGERVTIGRSGAVYRF